MLGVNTPFGTASFYRVNFNGPADERKVHAKGRLEVNSVRRALPCQRFVLGPFRLEREILYRVLLIEAIQRHVNNRGKAQRDDRMISPLNLGGVLAVAIALEHMDTDICDRPLPLISSMALEPDADNLRIMKRRPASKDFG